jgi:hypothetical protein
MQYDNIYRCVDGNQISARPVKSPWSGKCKLECSEFISDVEKQKIYRSYWNRVNAGKQKQFILQYMLPVTTKYCREFPGGSKHLITSGDFNYMAT